ncbi:MAG: hypothetical protein Q9201_002036 [Fulgogasparrea decipioides]
MFFSRSPKSLFPIQDKGKSRTYASYEEEIEALYKSADDAITDNQGLGMHQDIFSAAIDSLHVMEMARELSLQARRSGLRKVSAYEFLPDTIYKHPTLNQLKAFILQVAGVRASTKRTFSGPLKEQKYGLIDANADDRTTKSTSESVQALSQAYANKLVHPS